MRSPTPGTGRPTLVRSRSTRLLVGFYLPHTVSIAIQFARTIYLGDCDTCDGQVQKKMKRRHCSQWERAWMGEREVASPFLRSLWGSLCVRECQDYCEWTIFRSKVLFLRFKIRLLRVLLIVPARFTASSQLRKHS